MFRVVVQQTTLEAYDCIRGDLGRLQYLIFNTLRVLESASNRGIALSARLPINSVTPRVFELRRLGLVVHDGFVVENGRRVLKWRVNENV